MACRARTGRPRNCEGQWDLSNRWKKTSSYLELNGQRLRTGWRQKGRGVATRKKGNGNGGVPRERRMGWRERGVGGGGRGRIEV